jgi:zinc protease
MRLAGLAAGLVSMVLSATTAGSAIFNPETFTLSNGMQVVVIANDRAPIVTHMVWYKVGSADEAPGQSGVAHFLEHLMFKGTKTMAPGEFSRIIADNGGQENAFTSYDYTAYYQTVAADRLETMMRHEADRMTNLVLTEEIVAPERQVVLEERRSRVENRPSSRLREQADAAFWINHPYGSPVIGWPHEIAALSVENAIEFYRTWYAPNNAVLVIAGDVDPVEVRRLAEKYYGVIPARSVPARLRPAEPEHIARTTVELADPRVTRLSIGLRYLAPTENAGATEHAYPLQLLSEILSGGATSRLYRKLVVEDGIANSAGAWYDGDGVDLGSFGFYLTPKDGVDPAAAEAALEAEIARLLADGVTADELERARQRMLDAAIFARDSVTGPARIFGETLATGGTVEDVENWPERIGAVTVEQVNAAARHVLDRPGVLRTILKPAGKAS